MAYQNILTEFKQGLGTITLNRPPVNVLNIGMMEEINDALKGWQGKKDLKAVFQTPETPFPWFACFAINRDRG